VRIEHALANHLSPEGSTSVRLPPSHAGRFRQDRRLQKKFAVAMLCDCVVSVLMILDFKPVEFDWCVQDKDVSTYLRKLSLLDIVLLSEVAVPNILLNH
jgi:hypothetical protein